MNPPIPPNSPHFQMRHDVPIFSTIPQHAKNPVFWFIINEEYLDRGGVPVQWRRIIASEARRSWLDATLRDMPSDFVQQLWLQSLCFQGVFSCSKITAEKVPSSGAFGENKSERRAVSATSTDTAEL